MSRRIYRLTGNETMPTTTRTTQVSRRVHSGTTFEINMRREFQKILHGGGGGVPKAQQGVIRKINRDSNGDPVLCACRDSATSEPVKSPLACPLCMGEGYYWTETFIYFYRFEPGYDSSLALKEMNIAPGNLNVPARVFYLEYDRDLTAMDKVIELVLDNEGSPVTPYERRGIYRIGTLYDYRLDSGKIEYWKVVAFEDQTVPLSLE